MSTVHTLSVMAAEPMQDIRFIIECQLGFQGLRTNPFDAADTTLPFTRQQTSSFVRMFRDDLELTEDSLVYPNDHLVVTTHCGKTSPFVPARFDYALVHAWRRQWQALNDMQFYGKNPCINPEYIRASNAYQNLLHRRTKMIHASQVDVSKPPPSFLACSLCGWYGHWEDQCREGGTAVRVVDRRLPWEIRSAMLSKQMADSQSRATNVSPVPEPFDDDDLHGDIFDLPQD